MRLQTCSAVHWGAIHDQTSGLSLTAAVLASGAATSAARIPTDAFRADLAREIVRERGLPYSPNTAASR